MFLIIREDIFSIENTINIKLCTVLERHIIFSIIYTCHQQLQFQRMKLKETRYDAIAIVNVKETRKFPNHQIKSKRFVCFLMALQNVYIIHHNIWEGGRKLQSGKKLDEMLEFFIHFLFTMMISFICPWLLSFGHLSTRKFHLIT